MTHLTNYWRTVNFGYLLGYSPYVYSKKRKLVLFNPCEKIYRRMIVYICMVLAYEGFLSFRAIQVQMEEEMSPVEKIRSMSITVIYILFNFNHIITLKNYGSHHICINAFLKITNEIKENAGHGRRLGLGKMSKRTERFVSGFCAVFGTTTVLAAIARALQVFVNPASRLMLSSVANNPKMLPIWLKIPLALLHFHLTLFHAYFMVLHGATFYCYSASMVTTIHQTRDAENKGEKNESQMLSIYKNYVKLSVLQSLFSSIYHIWPLGFEVSTLFYSIIHIVLGVLFQNTRFGILGVVSTILLLSLFSNFAQLHSLSEESIQSWKIGMKGSTWFAKFHRSCQPLKIDIGNFFYADRALLLTILSIIIDKVTSLIVSYKDTH